jgi:hypothetical protein
MSDHMLSGHKDSQKTPREKVLPGEANWRSTHQLDLCVAGDLGALSDENDHTGEDNWRNHGHPKCDVEAVRSVRRALKSEYRGYVEVDETHLV